MMDWNHIADALPIISLMISIIALTISFASLYFNIPKLKIEFVNCYQFEEESVSYEFDLINRSNTPIFLKGLAFSNLKYGSYILPNDHSPISITKKIIDYNSEFPKKIEARGFFRIRVKKSDIEDVLNGHFLGLLNNNKSMALIVVQHTGLWGVTKKPFSISP